MLAAFQRICDPGPKTKIADWYAHTVLPRLWGFPASRFSSQAFWDRFDSIEVAPVPTPDQPETDDELLAAQDRLLQAFRDRQLVSQRVLAYDTTNFHTWIASDNERNTLARRGRNKQKRHDLRQVGLRYALDAAHGLSLRHHVYPGNVSDSRELPEALDRIAGRLDRAGIARETVTLTSTVLVTNRDDWSAAEVVAAYGQQQHVERVFRGLKGGGLVGWSPACHWTDSKLKVHAFYCMLGVSLLHYLHRRACAGGCPDLTLEQLCAELRQVQQVDLLYAPPDQRSQPKVVSTPSNQSLTQQLLVQALGIDELFPEPAAKGGR